MNRRIGFTPLESVKLRPHLFYKKTRFYLSRDFLTGFTIIELMVVIAVIMILVVIATPNMIRSKLNSNEGVAIGACRTISNACLLFYGQTDQLPNSLSALVPPTSNPPYISNSLANATIADSAENGYYYVYSSNNDNATFSLNAEPKNDLTGKRHFYVDQTGVIRATDEDRPATPKDPPI